MLSAVLWRTDVSRLRPVEFSSWKFFRSIKTNVNTSRKKQVESDSHSITNAKESSNGTTNTKKANQIKSKKTSIDNVTASPSKSSSTRQHKPPSPSSSKETDKKQQISKRETSQSKKNALTTTRRSSSSKADDDQKTKDKATKTLKAKNAPQNSEKTDGKVIGIFGDIHFQERGLQRIKRTGDWIIEEFAKQKVSAVVCLGDVLDTRENVSVIAQSSAISFLNKMSSTLRVPLHIILGNHDMHLKHSHAVTSLDCFSMNGMQSQDIHLHRELGVVNDICGISGLMMPYYEDQSTIIDYVDNIVREKGSEWTRQNLVGFGHLSVEGAFQHSKKEEVKLGGISERNFDGLKRTYSGHFHVPQNFGSKFHYVGAPLQFNFGDAGETRGIGLYHVKKDQYHWISNPYCQQFLIMQYSMMEKFLENPSRIKDTFISLRYTESTDMLSFPQHRKRLLEAGALGVQQESLLRRTLKKNSRKMIGRETDILSNIENFVKNVKNIISKSKTKNLTDLKNFFGEEGTVDQMIGLGKDIVHIVNDERNTAREADRAGPVFVGNLREISMSNFMGVQGELKISFEEMKDGIWVMEGKNGSGKSTIIEALSWCQFGEFIRSDMNKDFVINDQTPSKEAASVTVEYTNGFIIKRSRRKGKPDVLQTYQRDPDTQEVMELLDNQKGELSNTQKTLNHILGIDFSTYSKSIVLGQNVSFNFISGGKEERRKVLEEALGLERINLYYDYAHTQRREIEQELTQINVKRESYERELHNLESMTSSTNIEHELNELKEKVKSLEMEHQKNTEGTRLELANPPPDSFSRKDRRALQSLLREARQMTEMIMELNGHVHREGSNCPTCGQIVQDTEKMEQKIATIFEKVVNALDTASQLEDSLKILGEKPWRPEDPQWTSQLSIMISDALVTSETMEREETKREKEFSEKKMQRLRLENDLMRADASFRSTLSTTINRISSLEAQKSQIRDQHEQLVSRQNELKERLTAEVVREPDLQRRHRGLSFWEMAFDKRSKTGMGFSSLRGYVMEGAVASLNAICGEYMQTLGTPNLTVTFSSDLELEESYGKRSGGERRRTDLVTLFALFELVRQHSRHQAEYMILDEIFDALDADGLSAAEATIKILAEKVNKVFVISHNQSVIGSMDVAGRISFKMKRDAGGKAEGTSFRIEPAGGTYRSTVDEASSEREDKEGVDVSCQYLDGAMDYHHDRRHYVGCGLVTIRVYSAYQTVSSWHNPALTNDQAPMRRQLMSDGLISSSYDVTKVILHLALQIKSPDTKRKQFAILRLTCKSWKDIGETVDRRQAVLTFSVDSFTDCLGNVESLRFLLTRAELDPFSKDIGLLCRASEGE
ncbi:hypothetical protein PROFUN_00304 [Planoprotostelium fungivorum]|uniref:AAA+ ATPase domain-containing protein n=1 Tax=Planoprotostelium fungivorum TaxID=1890364 RepID=A0A2P6NY10_9EUKA|nr:hypothetical protein PROFUN_00304 [Planoprotostelium fungivorum]